MFFFFFFFFNDTATTEIYTLSLHDALPISGRRRLLGWVGTLRWCVRESTPAGWRLRRALATSSERQRTTLDLARTSQAQLGTTTAQRTPWLITPYPEGML